MRMIILMTWHRLITFNLSYLTAKVDDLKFAFERYLLRKCVFLLDLGLAHLHGTVILWFVLSSGVKTKSITATLKFYRDRKSMGGHCEIQIWKKLITCKENALLGPHQENFSEGFTRARVLQEEAEVTRSTKKDHRDFTCDYVLMIWPKLRNNSKLRDVHPHIKQPRDVGKSLKKIFLDSAIDMIVERVLVKYPSLEEEMITGLFRRILIAETLVRMLRHSKVNATMNPTIEKGVLDSRLGILKKWFLIEERMGGHLVIGVEEKPPFILAEKYLYIMISKL